MFGIGGGEIIFIIFIALMLFGSKNIPDIARALGKAMAQLKNATNEIKNEIHKGAELNELKSAVNDVKSSFTQEVDGVKDNLEGNMLPEIKKSVEDLEDLSGPIKRQS